MLHIYIIDLIRPISTKQKLPWLLLKCCFNLNLGMIQLNHIMQIIAHKLIPSINMIKYEQKGSSYLDTEVAPIHIISQEEVSCRGWRSTDLEQLHQVKELPMDVTTHCINQRKDIDLLSRCKQPQLFVQYTAQMLIHYEFIQPLKS